MAIIGIIALLWMSLLLAVSYFVFLTAEKAPEGVKGYGKLIGVVLVATALVIAISGITLLITNTNPLCGPNSACPMMRGMSGGMKDMGMGGKMGKAGRGPGPGPCGTMANPARGNLQ